MARWRATTDNDVADTRADKIAASEFAIEARSNKTLSLTLLAPQPNRIARRAFFERARLA